MRTPFFTTIKNFSLINVKIEARIVLAKFFVGSVSTHKRCLGEVPELECELSKTLSNVHLVVVYRHTLVTNGLVSRNIQTWLQRNATRQPGQPPQ